MSLEHFTNLFTNLNHAPAPSDAKIWGVSDFGDKVSCYLRSEWDQIDIARREKMRFTRTHALLTSKLSHSVNVKLLGEPSFTALGKGFPFSQETGSQLIWDVSAESGCVRAICIEYKLPTVAPNSAPNIIESCPKVGIFVQIWNDGFLTKTIKLPTIGEDAKHGKVCPANGVGFKGVSWSTDEKKLAYIAQETASNKSQLNDHPLDSPQSTFLYIENWGEQTGDSSKTVLCVLDLETETVHCVSTLVCEVPICPTEPVWSPHGDGIVFIGYTVFSYNVGLAYCSQRACHLYFWNMGDDRVMALDKKIENVSVRCPRFSPDGLRLVWLQNSVGGPHCKCSSLVCLFWPARNEERTFTVVPIVGKRITENEFPGLYYDLPERCWTCDSQNVVLSTVWGFQVVPLLISVAGCTLDTIPSIYQIPIAKYIHSSPYYAEFEPAASITVMELHSDLLIASVSTPAHPPHLAVLNLKNLNKSELQSDLNSRRWIPLPTNVMGDGEQCVVRSVKGMHWSVQQINTSDLQSKFEYMLVQPGVGLNGEIKSLDISDFVSNNKEQDELVADKFKGLIVYPHGGPHSNMPVCWSAQIAGFVVAGFAVLFINYRGSLGYGDEFLNSLLGFIGEKDVLDCVEATNSAVDYLHNYVSDVKVVLCGGSHGGFLSLHLAARYPNLYQAAVVRNPVTNLVSMMDETDIPDWCFTESGSTNWSHGHIATDEELIIMYKASPICYVTDKWSVPLLLLLGAKDRRVPCSQGLRFYHLLKANCPSLPCKLMMYPHDSHPLDSVSTMLNSFVSIVQWFYTHLKI